MEKLQKSLGKLDVKIDNNDLRCLYQEGCYKTIIPKTYNNYKELVLVNTSGGITSGDNLNAKFEFSNSKICISTQAAEKIYSGFGEPAKIIMEISLKNKSDLLWLPKELILFNNSNLKRNFNINLFDNSNLIMCETIVLGRKSMKEKLINGYFSDFWNVFENGKLVHAEAISFSKGIDEFISNKISLNNNYVVNTIIIMGEKFLLNGEKIKKSNLKKNGVVSEISQWDKKMIIRTLALDNYYLKNALDDILSNFLQSKLPEVWEI